MIDNIRAKATRGSGLAGWPQARLRKFAAANDIAADFPKRPNGPATGPVRINAAFAKSTSPDEAAKLTALSEEVGRASRLCAIRRSVRR